MILCPKCNSFSDVVDSRHTRKSIKRRRRCRKCGRRWTTFEATIDMQRMLDEFERSSVALRRRLRALEAETVQVNNNLHALARLFSDSRTIKSRRRKVREAGVAPSLRRWSKDDLVKLRRLYPLLGANATGIRLGRNPNGVRSKAHALGVRANRAARHKLEMNPT